MRRLWHKSGAQCKNTSNRSHCVSLIFLNFIRAINKRIRRLKDLLRPDSTFHQKQSETELRTYVMEVAELASELPESITQGIQWDLQIAVKAIVQEKKPKSQAPKPSLVVDIDEYDY